MVDTPEKETFSILPHDYLLERKEAKEEPMQPRRSQSPCFEDAQVLTMIYDNQIPIEVEDSMFSEASFYNEMYTVISETHKYASIECDDGIGKASLDMNGKTNTSPHLWDSYAECEEQFERSSSIHQAYLDCVQHPSLKYDEADLKVAAKQCQHANFNDLVSTSCIHDDVNALASSTSEKHEYPLRPQEPFHTSGTERTKKMSESSSKHSPYTQESQLGNFNNNECNPAMRVASSNPWESSTDSNINKVDSQNYQRGTLEYLKQSSFATAHIDKELNIPIQSEDAMMHCNEQIPISSESIKNVPNNLVEFQKSDFCYSQSTNKMGSALSMISEPCHNAMQNEITSNNQNQSQSSGSLDSSHIDIFNNMHLEELDSQSTASSLSSQDNSD